MKNKKQKQKLKLCSLQQQILLVEKYVSMLDGNIWAPSHLMISKQKIPHPKIFSVGKLKKKMDSE